MPKGNRGGQRGTTMPQQPQQPQQPIRQPSQQTQSNDPIEMAIGAAQGNPIRMSVASKDANLGYSTGKYEYRYNCQRCIMAYELRRRGYDVEAKERIRKNDQAPYMVAQRGWGNALNGLVQRMAQSSLPSRNTVSAMENIVRGWGNGARGIVRIRWKSGDGHVINVENDNGTVRFIDAQSGRMYVGDKMKNFMADAVKKNTMIARVDDLSVNTNIISDFVRKK